MSKDAGRVLLVEDDRDLLETLELGLKRRGFSVATAGSPRDALDYLVNEPCDVVITDLRMEGMGGLGLAERVVVNTDVPVIVVTGYSSFENAVAALRTGVFDFLSKPVSVDQLALAATKAARHRRLTKELERLRRSTSHDSDSEFGIVGESNAIKEALTLVRRVAPSDISVLITGESGTGKELAANAIHRLSQRADQPFLAVNCAAVPAALLESELFGHLKGSFTDAREDRRGLFVEASGGTLFLDEVGEMPLEMQSKLLRVLQENRVRPVGSPTETDVDTRIIAATNSDLEEEIDAGRFREDLYYRLAVVTITLPPLRQRGNDVLLIAQSLLQTECERQGTPKRKFSREVVQRLLNHSWPGNVRELSNVIARAVALSSFDEIMVEDLPERMRDYSIRAERIQVGDELVTLEEVERMYIQRVLGSVNGHKSAAARILGIDRRTLYRKLKRYGLSEKDGD